jgi:hypothetical protein
MNNFCFLILEYPEYFTYSASGIAVVDSMICAGLPEGGRGGKNLLFIENLD